MVKYFKLQSFYEALLVAMTENAIVLSKQSCMGRLDWRIFLTGGIANCCGQTGMFIIS